MLMTYSPERKRYEVKTSYQEYLDGHTQKVKDAGLRFTKDPFACWHTDDPLKASLLIVCADESTRRMLQETADKRAVALTASRAQDADLGTLLSDLGLEPYPFQKAGIAYGLDRNRVLFGDEPGLGKTLQALATTHIKQAYPCLAIVPATLKINWLKEGKRCIPELNREGAIRIIRGRGTGKVLELNPDGSPVLLWIINYDILESWVPELSKLKLESVIVDESHFFKEKNAKRTQAGIELITGIRKEGKKTQIVGPGIAQRYLLSGTSLLNRPKELLTQLEILGVIEQFGGSWRFLQDFCGAFSELIWVKVKGVATEKKIWHFDGATNTDRLQRRLRELVMVRRLKDDVLKELPPKRHQVIELEANGLQGLLDEQNEIYDRYEYTARSAGVTNTFEKACEGTDKTYQAFFTELARIAHTLALAKVPKVVDHCLSLLDGMPKLAVFAHHHDVIFELEKAFAEAGISTVRLTGMESDKEKDAAITAFMQGDARVFIAGLKCSIGYTITAASTAVFAELDWTPGVMDQSGDRLHRIGQTDSVLLTYIVLENSLDSKKVGMLLSKRAVIRAVLDDKLKEFDVPVDVPEDKKPKAPPKPSEYTEDQKMAMLDALRILAGNDPDFCARRNEVGFNATDTEFGHSLANCSKLTDKQAKYAHKMVQKYWRQIPDEIFERAFPGLKAKWGKKK